MLNEIFPPGFLALEKINTTSEISKKNETAKNMNCPMWPPKSCLRSSTVVSCSFD